MIYKKFLNLIIVAAILSTSILANGNDKNGKDEMKKEFEKFIKEYEAKVIPLYKGAAEAYFDASISGKKEDYDKSAELSIKLNKIYANKEDFAKLKKIKESNAVTDQIQKRQLEVIYNAYLGNQIPEEKIEKMISLSTDIENRFSTFRAEVNGKKLTDNEIEEILRTSKNSDELKSAYLESKKIGKVVAEDVVKLVKLRNEASRELGFSNFHEMSLKLSEQDPKEISALFDELDNLTRAKFAELKSNMDEVIANQLGISKDELMPWHYQNRFFQEAPQIYEVNLDDYYKDKDIVKLTSDYYAGIGLPIDQLIEKSDLYEKEGKYQHAYCTHIDKNGDVRVVMNVKPNNKWMNTSLHEYGHAVYDKYLNYDLPWQLREPAHTFTTEAIAMIFGRFASNAQWMQDMLGISNEEKEKIAEASFNSLRLEQLVFSRWVQVVYRFEKAMYENPDQDLNKLWWNLVEKYQMIKRPSADRNEPDWASKIHISSYPAYYHNYMLGELLASQLHNYIGKNVLKSGNPNNESYKDKKEVGQYLKDKVFAPGKIYEWNEMIEKATGEKLTAKYYADQFVK